MKDRRRASRASMAWTLAFGQPEDCTPTHWLRGDARGPRWQRLPRAAGVKGVDRPLAARFRTIQVCPKDIGALVGHTRSVDRPKPLNDALGSTGERSCTTIRQAPGGWQCPASASPKISRLVRMCSSQSIFGIGRSQHVARGTANMMLRLN
jgi:hypothetical protein